MHINRTPIIVDPGTYVYTSSPKKREIYRSENAHFSPVSMSNVYTNSNIFKIDNIYSCKVLHFSEFGFYGSMMFNNKLIERFILLRDDSIEIIDIIPSEQLNYEQIQLPYSLGYGIIKVNSNA